MTETQKDTQRAIAAAGAVFDGRDPLANSSSILVTLDHAIATVLLTTMGGDVRKAARMLNEGVLQSVEERLALYASKP